MADDRFEELASLALEGESTPEERIALEALLSESAERRAEYEDLAVTFDLLAQVEMVEPPPGLKGRIMGGLPVEQNAPARRRSAPSVFARAMAALNEAMSARPAFAFAYSMALGVIVGAAAWSFIADAPPAPAPSEVSGTIAPREAAALLRPVAEYAVDADGVGGTVRLLAGGDRLFLDLELAALAETEARVRFEPEALRWQGLTRMDERSMATLTARDGEATLTFSGAAHYLLSFEPLGSPSSLALTVEQGGEARYQQSIPALRPSPD